jgi:hypothetical protein
MRKLPHAWFRGTLMVVGLVLALGSVAAAQEVTYSVSGVEIGFTSDPDTSSFVGVAISDDDVASWQAFIQRDDLTSITGGTFELDGALRQISGVFDGGVIDRLPGSNCRMEKFHVTGELVLAGGGSGIFDVLLTHFGKRIGGQCVTYFATVEGAVTFDFSDS